MIGDSIHPALRFVIIAVAVVLIFASGGCLWVGFSGDISPVQLSYVTGLGVGAVIGALQGPLIAALLYRKPLVPSLAATFLVPTTVLLIALPIGACISMVLVVDAVWIGAAVVAGKFDDTMPFPAGHCQVCGYNLRGIDSRRCPECGYRIGVERPRTDADGAVSLGFATFGAAIAVLMTLLLLLLWIVRS